MTEGRQAVTQSCEEEAGPGHAAVVDERRCVSAGFIFLETSRPFNAVISKDRPRLIELVVSENQCIQVPGCVRREARPSPWLPVFCPVCGCGQRGFIYKTVSVNMVTVGVCCYSDPAQVYPVT